MGNKHKGNRRSQRQKSITKPKTTTTSASPSGPLTAGTPAPDFELKSTPDQKVSLSEFRNRPVILVFYPADFSPVCGDEMADFLSQSTLTAKVSTVSKDGTCHTVPVWFVLDGEDIIFTTWHKSVKAKHIMRDNRVTICVDDQKPLYSFVTMHGNATITQDKNDELLKWATIIAERYMGKENAERYGKRNSVKGELLIRVKPTKIIAQKDIAE
jgi:PPOX class probable F420-dependent enzyme